MDKTEMKRMFINTLSELHGYTVHQ